MRLGLDPDGLVAIRQPTTSPSVPAVRAVSDDLDIAIVGARTRLGDAGPPVLGLVDPRHDLIRRLADL